MRNRRNQEGSDAESSDDEQIIELPTNDFVAEDEDDDVDFEDLELTQKIPRKSDNNDNNDVQASPKKKKRKQASVSPGSHSFNGYRVREIDTTEIPAHIIANLKRVVPKHTDDLSDGLTVEAIQKATSSSKGGVWILKCPLDISLSDLLPGKKLSLDGKDSVIDTEDDALEDNGNNRQFEVTSVVNDEYKHGAALLLPDADKFKLVTAPIQGHLIIREKLNECQLPRIKNPKCKPRKLPAGIKERHPVYGADFTKIVNEMESAPKKKKKKANYEPEPEFEFNHRANLVIPKIEVESEDSTQSRKKKKKKKKDKNSEIYDATSNNGILENGNYVLTDSVDEDDSSRKKKSKKRKREELEDSYNSCLDTTVLVEEPQRKKHKKSKHKHKA